MAKSSIRSMVMLLTFVSFLVGCKPTSPATIPTAIPTRSIQLEPCTLSNTPAQCGVLSVYENRATNTGRKIDIHMAVIKSRDPNPALDPIVYVAGGPGASGIDSSTYALQLLSSATAHRDLILFDQRGTGQSNRMACPRQMGESLGLAPFDDKMLEDLRTCLQQQDGDPSAYTTAWGMDDLDEIRSALGYDQINLYGESYGTTAEQVYLQRHGDHVRTMAMQGVSLLGVPMFERMPRSSQQALDLLYTRCKADRACNSAYPNLSSELNTLIAQLNQQPVVIPVTDPLTGQQVKLTRDWLVLSIHSILLSTRMTVQLPGIIHQSYQGNWNIATQQLSIAFASRPSTAEWSIMNLEILCHEDWAKTRLEETNRNSSGSYMAYEDIRRFLAPEQVCALIPPPKPEALYEPVTKSSVPVLLISDQADPQNPVENVATAKGYYPNSLTLVAPGQGHGYTGIECRNQILAAFIEKGSAEGLSADCLQKVPLPAFQ